MTRSAISPRFATRTFSKDLRGIERDDVLAGVHERLVLDQEAHDDAPNVASELVERLHDLDQADHVTGLDRVALLDVRRRLRRRPPVEGPRQRCLDHTAQASSRLSAESAASSVWSAAIASSIVTSRKRTVSPTAR